MKLSLDHGNHGHESISFKVSTYLLASTVTDKNGFNKWGKSCQRDHDAIPLLIGAKAVK